LGVISSIASTKKTGYEDMWSVVVQGKVEQLKFMQTVGGIGLRKIRAEKAISILENILENPNNDVIPKEVWGEIEDARRHANLTTREFHKKLGWAYSGTQRHNNGISRTRLVKICQVLPEKRFLDLADSDFYWDEVIGIIDCGEAEVFDATVPEKANFVANDILVHNSIEQDADVVMFLYKPDDNSPEDYKLSIAKHRNGPLASVDLKFKGEKIKFYGVDRRRG
jgi:replicative DNA helicase